MLVAEARREVRTIYLGGLAGQLVSSTIWVVAAAVPAVFAIVGYLEARRAER